MIINKLMWAACCIAFFGFLRCSELTVSAQNSYDTEVQVMSFFSEQYHSYFIVSCRQ